jgi:uncharacterized protein (DUF1684 family)
MKTNLIILCLPILFLGCKIESSLQIDAAYKAQVKNTIEKRNKNRVNYLQLTGLFEIDSTTHSFGKASTNTFSINVDQFPDQLGNFKIVEDYIVFSTIPPYKVKTSNGNALESIPLIIDQNGDSELLYYKDVKWRVITRSGSLFVRVWDKNNPAIDSFKGFEHYKLNDKMIFEANFIYFDETKTEAINSKLGRKEATDFVGTLHFIHDNKNHTLDVADGGFLIVGDLTSGESSYGGGRYMYLKLPEENGEIIIDFNQLYNPPCSYSEFTTCLLTPRQNQLDFKIEAGEQLLSRSN